MLGGADNPNGELPSYITGADTLALKMVRAPSQMPLMSKLQRCLSRVMLCESTL